MQIKCEWCGAGISDTESICPYCSGVNSYVKRSADGAPVTVEQLKAWCREKGMPLEKMRFFIGTDYKGPKAFGIYKNPDTGDFVVYKNKSDGTRAVRYEGPDEVYAVNEIYQKIRSETVNQAALGNITRNGMSVSHERQKPKRRAVRTAAITALSFTACMVILAVSMCLLSMFSHLWTPYMNSGYYEQEGSYYYNDYGTWYAYDGSEWRACPQGGISEDDFVCSIYGEIPGVDFKTSGYYEPESNAYFKYDDGLYAYNSGWYCWDGSAWKSRQMSEIPMELRKHYGEYSLGWAGAVLPSGVTDFRSTDYYKMPGGYYDIGGQGYYNYYNNWYRYDGDDYEECDEPDDAWNYEDSRRHEPSYGMEDFYESDAYDEEHEDDSDTGSSSYGSDWDDYDYDYGGWDSSDTDWDSDW